MASVDVQVNLQLSQRQLNAVTRQIQSSLGNLSAKNLTTIDRELNKGAKSAQTFGEAIGLSARRFVAYTSAVAVVGRLSSSLARATRDAIKFEREFVKLAQVFDTSVRSLGSLSGEISNLSKEFGINANVIARTSVILAQSGLSARDTEKALRSLAKTTLASTFEDIGSTAEGAVAILAQFGAGVSALESQLGSINAVAKRFAVESGDIIEAVRRAGGAFNAAGGSFEEFIALFTSVRSTTRESAETIATGFRTIFARIQRPKVIDYFRQLNIELTDGQGNFVGAFEAIKRLSEGLERAGIKAGQIRFAEIVEQLGGIRQVSRVIPLLGQFAKAQEALNVAQTGSASLNKDVAKAQETVAQAFARTQENFSALIREISQTATFQTFVKIALDLANAFIEVARALKPLIPLIGTLGAIKLGGIASQAIKRASSSSSVIQFARGGVVPGSGNGDTVPAMLEPGEFVIRKSAVQAFGADRLAGINKYASGGRAKKTSLRGINKQKIDYTQVDRINKAGEFDNQGAGALKGLLFERFIATRLKKKTKTGPIDFPTATQEDAKKLSSEFGTDEFANMKGIEATYNRTNAIRKKLGSAVAVYGEEFAKGGAVGTDTVPALLTPGEFVVNKKSAEAYGYGNLKKINKYAKGGVVQKFANGGEVGGGFNIGKLESLFLILPTLLSTFASSLGGADSEVAKFTSAFGQNLLTIKAIQKGSQAAIKGLFNLGRDKDPIQEKSEVAAKSIESSGSEISSSVSSSGKKVAVSLGTLADAIRGIQDKLKGVRGAVKGEKEARRKLNFVRGQQQQLGAVGLKLPQSFVDAAEKELAEATKKLAKYRSLSGAKARLLGEAGFKNQKELNAAVKKEAKEANRRAQAADFLKTKLKESRLKTIKAEGGTLKDAPRSRPFLKSLRETGSLTNAFGRIAKVAGKIPGPWGKVIQIGSKVVQGLNFLGIALATTVATVFQRIGQNAEEQSERAIKQGDAARAQEQAIRASENQRAAQNLTIATGVLSGILGDAAGGFTATILSLTGVLDPLVNGFTKFGQGLAKAGVSFLNYIGLVDDERAAQFNASFITPEQQLALDGFTAALKASTERLKLQSELLDKEIASIKRTFGLIDDYNNKIDYLSQSLQNIVNQREQRTGIVIPGRESPVQYSDSLRANLDELLSKNLGEAFVANVLYTSPIGGLNPARAKENVDVVINQAMMNQMQEFSKALDEAKKSLENFNIKVLEQISFSLSVAKTNQDIYRILKIDSDKFRFTVGETGESILSFESIISSPILKEAFISLYRETGNLEGAQRRLSESVRVETELKRASIEYEKTRINAFSNLLQKFTFGTGEERFGIGQDIKSVEKLVNSGFDINARNIAESERSRILSFLQSAPGALFKTKDGVVSSEDIAVKTILKQFEGLDLSGLLTEADRETVDAIKDTGDQDKKRQELIEQRLKESLYPQRAALDELKAINGGVSELVNASKGQVPNAQQTVADQKARAKLESEVPEYDQARAAKEAGIDNLIDTIKIEGTTTVDVKSANIFFGKITNEQLKEIKSRNDAQKRKVGDIAFSKGGIVYAQNGTLVNYEPRGTDTVPAMLTPGEFVVNARATKNNLGLLEAINAGAYSRGGVVYLQGGGSLDDTIARLEAINREGRNRLADLQIDKAERETRARSNLGDTRVAAARKRSQSNIASLQSGLRTETLSYGERLARARQSSKILRTTDQNRDRITYDDRFNIPRAAGGQSRAVGGRTVIAGDRVINYAAASNSTRKNPFGEARDQGRYKLSTFLPSSTGRRLPEYIGQYQGPKVTQVYNSPAYGAEGPGNRRVATLRQYGFPQQRGPVLAGAAARKVLGEPVGKYDEKGELIDLDARRQELFEKAARRYQSLQSVRDYRARVGRTSYRRPDSALSPLQKRIRERADQRAAANRQRLEAFSESPSPPPLPEPASSTPPSPSPQPLPEPARAAGGQSRAPLPSYFLQNQPKPQTPSPTPPTQRFPIITGQFGRRRLRPPGFSHGGFVNPQYLANGGQAHDQSVDTSALAGFAASFGASVSNLINSSITMEIAPIGINVNLNGAELLSRLPEMVQGLVMDSIRAELTLFEQTKDFNNTPGAYASAIR